MTQRREHTPATVALAQQAGATDADRAILSRWRWVQPCAWTVRMLTALETPAVKGAPWFRLIDQVFSERNLWAAFQQVAGNDGAPGMDHVTTSEFERRLPDSIGELSDSIKSGQFTPQAIRRVHIPKPGTHETRPLGIPTVRDRVVQAAIVNVIEPIFERDFGCGKPARPVRREGRPAKPIFPTPIRLIDSPREAQCHRPRLGTLRRKVDTAGLALRAADCTWNSAL